MKHLFTFAKLILIGITFYFIIRYLSANWYQFSLLELRLNYFYVVLAFIVMIIAWATTAWSWGKTLEIFGYKLPYTDIFVIYFRSMLAKYLPGKVWQLATSTYIAVQRGVPEGATIGSFILGQAYSVLSGVVLVVVAIALGILNKSGETFAVIRWTSIPILIAMIILILKPDLIESLMNWALRIVKRREISIKVSISTSFFLFLAFLVPWFIFGLSFWILANSLTTVSIGLYISLTTILTAGTVIGFLAVFAPGGIGVKEASIAALVGTITGFPPSFGLALGFGYRIVSSVIEVMAFGFTWAITSRQKYFSRQHNISTNKE